MPCIFFSTCFVKKLHKAVSLELVNVIWKRVTTTKKFANARKTLSLSRTLHDLTKWEFVFCLFHQRKQKQKFFVKLCCNVIVFNMLNFLENFGPLGTHLSFCCLIP